MSDSGSGSGGCEMDEDGGLDIQPPQPMSRSSKKTGSRRDILRGSSSRHHRESDHHHHRSSSGGSSGRQRTSHHHHHQEYNTEHTRRYVGGSRGGAELVEDRRVRRRELEREEEKKMREIEAKREREIRFNSSANTNTTTSTKREEGGRSSTTITISTSTHGGRRVRAENQQKQQISPPRHVERVVVVKEKKLPEVQEVEMSSPSSSDGEIHQDNDDENEDNDENRKKNKSSSSSSSSSSSNESMSSSEEQQQQQQQQQMKKKNSSSSSTTKRKQKTSKSASSVSSVSSSDEGELGDQKGKNQNRDFDDQKKRKKRPRKNSDSNSSISQDELSPPPPPSKSPSKKDKIETTTTTRKNEGIDKPLPPTIKIQQVDLDDDDDDDDLDDLDDDDEVVQEIKKKVDVKVDDKNSDELSGLPPYLPALQGCRSVEEFQMLNRIEEGTYGIVFRARDKRTSEIVALKRLKMEKEKEGFPITSLREINTLLKAQHENIVTVREIVVGSNIDKIFLVMDYVEHDLKELMETLKRQKSTFIIGEVKCLLLQLLRAVAHMHDNWILHRDLKTSNLLLSHKGILKVGDFGLAREYGSPLKGYTPIVVTLWYRAPELLLGTKQYSTPIDVWSVGCIFGELLKMEPMFPGKSEANQLNLIFQTLGTPNDRIWPGYSQLPLLQKMTFTEYPINKLKSRFPMLTEAGIDLMNKFLTYNPAKRVGAEEALKHRYFTESPLPIDPSVFPTWPAKSELGARPKGYSSPKPPSGGGQFKELQSDDPVALYLSGQSVDKFGGGFSLKF